MTLRTALLLASVVASAAACRGGAGDVAPMPSLPPTTPPTPGTFQVRPGMFEGKPHPFQPPVPAPTQAGMGHAHVLGWNAAGTEFGYCAKSLCVEKTRCEFAGVDGARTVLEYGAGDEKGKKAVEARLAGNYLVRNVYWIDPEVRPAWAVTGTGAHMKLEIGASWYEEAPLWSMTIGPADGLHPEALVFSADRKWFGALAHGLGAKKCEDRWFLEVHPAVDVVRAVKKIPADKIPGLRRGR